MSLSIKISNFEGPFDLLLHLIKKNQMDIYNISIFEITKQYLGYLDQMKEMDLDITSEFIVIAATLIEIKSKFLLPKNKLEEDEVEERDEAKELIDKLIQYKKFKMAAEFLGEKEKYSGIMYTKKPEIIEPIRNQKDEVKNLFKNITMMDLYNIYNELIKNYNEKMNSETNFEDRIKVEIYKIEDKMEELKSVILKKKKFSFNEFIHNLKSKTEIIVTFLALLELVKLRNVVAIQLGNFNEIYLERIDTDE